MINQSKVIRQSFFAFISLTNCVGNMPYLKVMKKSKLNPKLKSVESVGLMLSKKYSDNK